MLKTIKNIIETITFTDETHHHLVPLKIPACYPLREAGLIVAGISTVPRIYSVERRQPDFHEVLYTLSGTGRLDLAKGTLRVSRGEVMVLPAGSWYRYYAFRSDWRIMWFHLHNSGMWLALEGAEPHVREGIATEELRHAVEELLAESVRDDTESVRLVTSFAEQIVLYLSREVVASGDAHEHKRRQLMHDLWNLVNARLQVKWTVEQMAARLNMSPAHFHRVCLRYSGCAPKQMLFRLRMQRAEELLLRYDYPLKTIAEELGYGTPFAFSNAFKRYKGISPRQFRRQYH